MVLFHDYVSLPEEKCPMLGNLNITFKYLLEIVYPQYLSDVQVGHLPTPIITVFHLGGNGLVRH